MAGPRPIEGTTAAHGDSSPPAIHTTGRVYDASSDPALSRDLDQFTHASDADLERIFGYDVDLGALHDMQDRLRSGDALPDAQLADLPEGIRGAYVDGQIYLDADLSPSERRDVYREELGHYIDDHVRNGGDSVGDEGARFREWTGGQEVKAELGDDHGTVSIAGKARAAEFSRAANPGEELVTVYRVEGANQRVVMDAQGDAHLLKSFSSLEQGPSISPNEGAFRDVLFLNFGDRARAEEFARTRAAQGFGDTVIKSFQIPKSLADEIRKSAVDESQARDPRLSNRPFKVDVNHSEDSFGLRWDQVRKINDQMISGSYKVEALDDGVFYEIPPEQAGQPHVERPGEAGEIEARGTEILDNLEEIQPLEGLDPAAIAEAEAVQIADAAHFVIANPDSPAAQAVGARLSELGVEFNEGAATDAVHSLLEDATTAEAVAGHTSGALGAAFKWGGRAFLVVGVAADGYKIYSADDKAHAAAEVAGGWSGALAGAEAGAALGAAGGPIGAAVGGFVGGALGYFGGSWFGGWLEDKIAGHSSSEPPPTTPEGGSTPPPETSGELGVGG